MRLIANRKRNETISFRLTINERRRLEAKRKLSGMPMHEFIMECLNHTTINVRPGANRLVVETKRIGNNLNQIARRVNAGQITDCRRELRSIENELTALRREWQS